MSLLIDIGNTRIKVGYADADGIRQPHHTIALTHAELSQLPLWLKQHGLRPDYAFAISVSAPALSEQLCLLLHQQGCRVHWLDATTACNLLHNDYEYPERLGADRWLALIGVLALHKKEALRPIVHASFGTATTVDTIMPASTTQSARFVGGLILPGPKLMYDSLALNTAKLGNGIGTIAPFPTNTRAAVSSGIAAAQAGAVLRQWQLAAQYQQGTPLLVCSGGGWELIQEEIYQAYSQQLRLANLDDEPVIWQPTPVLDGLAYMATQNLLTD